MKRRLLVYSMLMLIAVFAFVACGGGGGGGGFVGTTDGTFIKHLMPGGTTSGALIFTDASPRHYQALYNSSDMDASGYIEKISFSYISDEPDGASCDNFVMRMGHTGLNDLGTPMSDNYEDGHGSLKTVIANTTIAVPAGSKGDFFDIVLDTPFYYNGKDNLVIDITRGSACSGGDGKVFLAYVTTAYTAYIYDDNRIGKYGLNSKFHYKGGVDRITQDGSLISSSLPFTTSPKGQHAQLLFLSEEINGSGPITGMALKVGATTTNQVYTLDVKVGHTSIGNLVNGSDFADNFSGAPVTVAGGAVWNVPVGVAAGEFIWLPFPDGTFHYNGTDNLLVEINVISASGTFTPASTTASTMRRITGPNGSVTSDSASSALYIAAFRFKGGTADVLLAGGGDSIPMPFYNIDAQVIDSYSPSDIGAKGRITKIALRLKQDSVAESYPNYTITMGYANTVGIADPMAIRTGEDFILGHMTGAKTVYSGTITIPAGLKDGDWFEIPLSSVFSYDGIQPLMVHFDHDAATGGVINLMQFYMGWHSMSLGWTDGANYAANSLVSSNDYFIMPTRFWLE